VGRIVAVTNLKGGIGKTTTVVNVGAGLALKGARVLLVDTDAQGNLAPALGLQPRRTIYSVLMEQANPLDCLTPARPNLDLLAADDALLTVQAELGQRPGWVRILETVLAPARKEYDFIIIDAPGSLTVMSASAIAASSDLLVPTTVEPLSLKGLDLLFKQLVRLKNSTRSVRVIVPTMFDGRLRQAQALLSDLQERHGALVVEPIHANVRLSEATAEGKTIYEYDRRSRGAFDYAQLVEHLSALWQFAPPPSARPAPARANSPPNQPPSMHAPARTNGSLDRSDIPLHPPATHDPSLPDTCPNCGRPLNRTTLAGYRVVYCNHCRFKQQGMLLQERG